MTSMTTLPQIPENKAGRVHLPRLPRLRRRREEEFFVATELVEASSDARRAQILLRLPDAVLLDQVEAITAACRETGFKVGVLFIGQRIAALSATRWTDGELPEHMRATLTLWRDGMASIAGGTR